MVNQKIQPFRPIFQTLKVLFKLLEYGTNSILVSSRFAEIRFAETRFAETRFAETRFAETRFAETRFAEIRL